MSSSLEITILPVLKDNYIYVVTDSASGETAAIDPSTSDPVRKLLHQRGKKLDFILNTHHHSDHVGGNAELKAQTSCRVLGSWYDRQRIPLLDQPLRDNDRFKLGTQDVQVLHVPGHTLGHIAFWFNDANVLFCGDTLFSLGCGRLFEGTPLQMWNSLNRIAKLPDQTLVYCAHEYTQANGRFAAHIEPENPELQARLKEVATLRAQNRPTLPSSIGLEKATNPFLRVEYQSIKESLDLSTEASAVEAFTELRKRKDGFT